MLKIISLHTQSGNFKPQFIITSGKKVSGWNFRVSSGCNAKKEHDRLMDVKFYCAPRVRRVVLARVSQKTFNLVLDHKVIRQVQEKRKMLLKAVCSKINAFSFCRLKCKFPGLERTCFLSSKVQIITAYYFEISKKKIEGKLIS
jgi:hypothetical protein